MLSELEVHFLNRAVKSSGRRKATNIADFFVRYPCFISFLRDLKMLNRLFDKLEFQIDMLEWLT